jgi:hypothetical protein
LWLAWGAGNLQFDRAAAFSTMPAAWSAAVFCPYNLLHQPSSRLPPPADRLIDLLQIFAHVRCPLLHQTSIDLPNYSLWMGIQGGWICYIFSLCDFDRGGRSLNKTGREDVWRRRNNRDTYWSTTCRLTGDRKMRATYMCLSREKLLGERSGRYLCNWQRRWSNIRPSLLVLRKDTSRLRTKGSERSHASTRQVEAFCESEP